MFSVKVSPDDAESYVLEIKPRDVLVWEKGGKGRSLKSLEDGSLGDIYELAHASATRQGKTTLTLPAFKLVADVEPLAPAEDADPKADASA
jgi:hypothetical protein